MWGTLSRLVTICSQALPSAARLLSSYHPAGRRRLPRLLAAEDVFVVARLTQGRTRERRGDLEVYGQTEGKTEEEHKSAGF